jgi:DNA-directed RNA polymerase alpha subunit
MFTIGHLRKLVAAATADGAGSCSGGEPSSVTVTIPDGPVECEHDLLATPLAQIVNEPRLLNVLERIGIRTLGELCAAKNEDLVQTPGLGPKSIQSLRAAQERALTQRS